MKYFLRPLFIFVLITSTLFSVNAQFSKSSKLISAGVSLGLYGKYYHSNYYDVDLERNFSFPVSLQFETGLGEESKFGEISSYITTGFYVGFQSQHYSKEVKSITPNYDVYRDHLFIWGGVVGSFHGVPLLNEGLELNMDATKWDLYISIKGGVVHEKYTSNYDDNPTSIDVQTGTIDIKQNKTHLYIAPVIGGRYYFAEKLAVYAEIGRSNLSNLSVGLSMKL